MSQTLLLVVALFFGIYFMLSGLEAGISLLYIMNVQSADNVRPGLHLFTPLWEVTNVFLVFGFTGLAVVFNNSLPILAHAVLSTVIVGLVALIIRAITGVYIFYFRGFDTRSRLMGYVFLLASFAVPVSFGLAGIYLLAGQDFWQSSVGIMMAITLVLSTIALSVTFARVQTKKLAPRSLRIYARLLPLVFCLAGGIGLQVVVNQRATHLLSWPYDVFILGCAAVALVQVFGWLVRYERIVWWYLSLLAFVSPALLALANRPYIIYPRQTIADAYGAAAFGKTVLIGTAVVAPLMLVGFGLLVWLIVSTKKQA